MSKQIAWNKGMDMKKKYPHIGFQKGHKTNIGRKHSDEFKRKLSLNKKGKKLPQFTGEKNPCWKGNIAGNVAIHMWIRKHWGKPNKCENKECEKKSNKYEWSNIDHKYSRDRKDWLMLCILCHRRRDVGGKIKSEETKKRIKIILDKYKNGSKEFRNGFELAIKYKNIKK